MEGRIVNINQQKGFGFVTCYKSDNIFFHVSDMEKAIFQQLERGDHVTYEESKNKKGKIAKNLRIKK